MSLIYNHVTGSVVEMPELAAKAFMASGSSQQLGWHGPYATKDEVVSFYNASKGAHPDWKKPEGLLDQVLPDIPKPGTWDPLGFTNLNWQSLLIRLTEIVLGTVLLAVGISHLSGGGGDSGTVAKLLKAVRK